MMQVKDRVRTLNGCGDGKYGTMEYDHPAMGSLVKHTCDVITRHGEGEDGKTAHQRWKGR